jgi:hypothetical protein
VARADELDALVEKLDGSAPSRVMALLAGAGAPCGAGLDSGTPGAIEGSWTSWCQGCGGAGARRLGHVGGEDYASRCSPAPQYEIAFSGGLAGPDAASLRDLHGRIAVDASSPMPRGCTGPRPRGASRSHARSHRVSAVGGRAPLAPSGGALELYSSEPFLTNWSRLKPRIVFALSVTGGHLYATSMAT